MRLFQFRTLSRLAGGSDTSQTQLIYKVEGTYPTTLGLVASPNYRKVRFTRSSMNHRNNVGVSAEIRPDRMRSDQMILAYTADGAFDMEWHSSIGTQPFAATVNPGGLDDFMEAAVGGTWSAGAGPNTLDCGSVPRSFSFEQGYIDISRFLQLQGCVIEEWDVNITSNAIITSTVTILGQRGNLATPTSIDPAALVPTSLITPITAGPLITGLSANTDLSGICVRSIRFKVKNNNRYKYCVDTYSTQRPGMGTLEITGTMEMFFTNSLTYLDFINNSPLDFAFTIGDVVASTGHSYQIRWPKLKFKTGAIDIGGVDDDVVVSHDFQCFAGPGVPPLSAPAATTEMRITRSVPL